MVLEMHTRMPRNVQNTSFSTRVRPCAVAADGGGDRATRKPVVRAKSLKAAIAQLRELTESSPDRSSQQALAANLMLLRALGVAEDALDLVIELVLAQNVDEEMTAAINYLASGFLLALLTLREEEIETQAVGADDESCVGVVRRAPHGQHGGRTRG